METFAVPLGSSLTVFGVVALVAHAFVSIGSSASSAFKRYTAKQMLIALVVVLASAMSAGGRVIVRVASGVVRWWLLFTVVFVSFSCLYVTYTEFPGVWLGTARFYNASLGPLLHQTVIAPLQVLDLLLRALLPIWDSGVWFVRALVTQGLLPVMFEEAAIVRQMATALLNLVGHLSDSLLAWVDSFFCSGAACLHPEKGVIDVLSPMGDARELVALGIKLGRAFCSGLAAPLDLLLFPLLDLNLAEAVHHLANAVVQALTVIPRATLERCALKGGNQFDVLMCTPDVAPFFHFVVAALSSLGHALDNWANVAFLIVETSVTGAENAPRCDPAGSGMMPDLVAADAVFGGARTAVVGLTDWLYAVTDGRTALYMGHNDGGQTRLQAWPYPGMVDVGLGLAAVTYSSAHDLDVSALSGGQHTSGAMQTTAMLGCNCSDDALLGMQIVCSILPMAGVPVEAALKDYLLQVLWPDAAAAKLYTCSGVDIHVKPVRWSYTRYSSPDATLGSSGDRTTLPTTQDCIARGTCREVDATVWVVPRCAEGGGLGCVPAAACFPFCMAARAAGSGRDNLFLARAGRWRDGLMLMGQDCALATTSPGLVGSSMGDVGAMGWAAGSGSKAMFGSTYQPQECQRAPRVTTVVDHPPPPPASAARIRVSGQPFAITGDTALVEVDGDSALGGVKAVEAVAGSVQVERLGGDEVGAFSLRALAQTLPSLDRVLVPADEAERADASKVTVPYSYGTTRIAATNSRDYVFYASNPSMDVFGAYLEYCSDKSSSDRLARMGLLAMSSFSPMRVYRVAAYRRCAAYSCGPDLVRFVQLKGFDDDRFDKECTQTFNTSVVALEYLNPDNIAVTVQSSHVTEYDKDTLTFSGNRTRRKTYWLNPASMALSETIWQTAVPASNFAVLCPSLQRLPRAGSFFAEVLNSGVFLLQYAVSAVVYSPGMVMVWRAGGVCPPAGGAAHYHSVLGGCGGALYSLDDFFDSVDDAGALFWHSLSQLARLVSPPSVVAAAVPLTQVLDGMGQYGEAMVDMWSARSTVLTLTRVPVKEQLEGLWATLQPSGEQQKGLAYGSAALSGWSRFSYKAVSTVGQELVRRALHVNASSGLSMAGVFKLIWGTMYDLGDEFDTMITAKNRMGCGGLRLIFGVSNPWASLVYHQCAAAAELVGGLRALATDLFVLVPMAKCVCKDSQGADVAAFTTATCALGLPVSLLPTLYTVANEVRYAMAGGSADPYEELRCAAILGRVKRQLAGTLDGWFSNQHLALEALGSAVDYATSAFDEDAGRCLDFAGDPHVVVLVPQPVDYFQRCAGTSRCKAGKCAAQWAQFQDANAPGPRAATPMTVTTESAFFPSAQQDPDLMLTGQAMAIVEVPTARGVCVARARMEYPDYALAVAELVDGGVRVRYWCAPLMGSAGLYRNATSGYGPVTLPGTLLSLQFGDETGTWLAALTAGPSAVYVVNRTGAFRAPGWDDLMQPKQVLMRVENLWVVEGTILVDLVTRRMTTTGSAADSGGLGLDSLSEALHVFLRPPLGEAETNTSSSGRWHGTDVDLMAFGGGQYWYTRFSSYYVFLPRPGRGGMMQRVRLELSEGGKTLWLTQLESTELQLVPGGLAGLSGAVVSTASQHEGLVFGATAASWDWLRQARLDPGGYVLGVYGSASVRIETTIDGRCDELGCEGCATLVVQRLCQAYSQCALINCVGTPVHQRRPLCGVGALLRHYGEMSLRSTHGAWTIFTEMLALTLELGLLSVQEAHLLWPEDSFLCYVCEAKDATAEFFSILTATINSALQLGEANVAYMYGGASNVDANADAALTISSTALNGLMHQAALLPLFLMVASRQVMMCQVTGVLALLDEGGFKLTLRQAGEATASDVLAGQCLTVGAEVLANYPGDSPSSVAFTVASVATNAVQLLLIQQIEPLLHGLDAGLAYVIGVVHALGVLVMSQNQALCNPPQFDLAAVLRCACGDYRLQIPPARRAEGLEQGALWCTGVLSMIDGNGQPYYIYNPYTYAELQGLSSGLDAYAQCVGSLDGRGYSCQPPAADVFTRQGVTLPNVLVKCRDNFIKKQWDPYAFALFNRPYQKLFATRLGYIVPLPDEDPFGIAACLQQDPAEVPSLAQVCLQEFLALRGTSWDNYWAYERASDGQAGGEYTDACLVFSGPAAMGTPLFVDCVDGMMPEGGRCTLAGHAWSPLSENQVPVGGQHRVLSRGVHADGVVQELYAAARRMVVSAVDASLDLQLSSGSSHMDIQIFSVEGDVLHQTMDCLFMGPYARMDYWPIPSCGPGEECLTGPYWARSEDGGRGVDPDACASQPTLPYTCGSPARQALMRFLVRDVLPNKAGSNANGSVIHETVVGTLRQIRDAWGNTSLFGCPCAHGVSPACCAGWNGPLLPGLLNQSFMELNASRVLQAMSDDLAGMHASALESREPWLTYLDKVAPGERAAYAAWNASRRVTDEARFDPTQPVAEYASATEALVPLQSSLWDVCHAALKQTFFTLPLVPGGDDVAFDLPEFDGDPARLREFVRNLTFEAWRHSPLFRHYSPRHVPSESGMCAASQSSVPLGSDGTVAYSTAWAGGAPLLRTEELPTTTPAYSVGRFRVGEAACLCGWARVPGGRCQVPYNDNTDKQVCGAGSEAVCSAASNYTYDQARDEASVAARFQASWFCPEFDLSPHWGFTDADAAEAWTSGQPVPRTSARDLLQHGRAGLRLGNVFQLPRLAKGSIQPSAREVPLERGRLTTCNASTPDLLFPVAQAVDEGGATAYCMRYVLELARLAALEAVPGAEGEAALQKERTEVWHRRCGAQLHLLHLCRGLGVFRARLVPAVCPHFTLSPQAQTLEGAYVTKECLVGTRGGDFYDPCRCVECAGDKLRELDLAFVLRTDQCRLRFDPRRDSLTAPDAPLGWISAGEHPLPDPAARLLSARTFAREVLADPDAAGNTASSTNGWWQAEGLMAETGELCDGVLDWWPEEWAHPVGYHVTVPCDANDTAYRSFAQAFAWEDGELVYQHDLMRDAALADSHFGVGGLCRRGSFGMPLFETNTMAYCTSHPDTSEDFAVPWAGDSAEWDGPWTPMKCAPSSRDLPWPGFNEQAGGLYDAGLFSVGTVPHMPPEAASTYPATAADMSEVGPWQEVIAAGASWGAGSDTLCQDFPLALCLEATDCPAGYECRGRVCSGDAARACTRSSECAAGQACRGVCMEATGSDCVRHSDCKTDARLMCSGVGKCEQPTVVVDNQLPVEPDNNTVSFTLAVGPGGDGTMMCGTGARAFSLVGGSYWGNTGQDLLRVHGMCSFEDWFKYTSYYAGECGAQQADGTLRVDPKTCSILKLSEQQLLNQSLWWPEGNKRPELMFLRPTNCDRDYERLRNFTLCAPLPSGGARLRFRDDTQAAPVDFDRFVRLHSDADGSVRLAGMPERNDTQFGVLGLAGAVTRDAQVYGVAPEHAFLPCSLVRQCFAPPFTVNGAVSNRTFVDPSAPSRRQPYNAANVFKCGVFGLEGSRGCQLDTEVLPLYTALCRPESSGGIPQCQRLVEARLCENIRAQYQPTNADRTSNREGLRDLFYAFPAFATVEAYMDLVDCMQRLHATLAPPRPSKGLYYPMMYVLKEVPFDWYFQCVVMGGLRVNEAAWQPQDCVAYKERAIHTLEAYTSINGAGDSLLTYLRYVRGGYTWAAYNAFLATQLDLAVKAVKAARASVQAALYPGRGDESYPVCSRNLLWRIGPYGTAYSDSDPQNPDLRAIIANWYDPQECRASWHEGLIADLPKAFAITPSNWMAKLSTFDPVNIEPQSIVKRTLLQEIEASMTSGFRIDARTTVRSRDKGGLYFNNGVAPRYDPVARPVSPDLIPRPSLRQGEQTTGREEELNRTCAYIPESDPAFLVWGGGPLRCEDTPQSGGVGRKDTLRDCAPVGGSALRKTCTSVPTVSKKDGQFNCRYQAAGNIIPPGCTESITGRDCYTDVLQAMYAAVLKRFRASKAGSAVQVPLPAVPLPWFLPGAGFAMDNFNLSNELDYERNIQPNPEMSVMCEITATENVVKYTQCTSPHYATLKAHAAAHYRRDGAVTIPAGARLEWPVDRAVLARGVIPWYARRQRPLNQTYLDALFDDATVCKGKVVETQRVCWKQAELKFATVNPWLLGGFNPFEACDVDWTDTGGGEKEFIYSPQCPAGDNAARCGRFQQKLLPSRCKESHRKLVSLPGVPRTVEGRALESNLCFHRIYEDADGCLHDQGLLGGYDGSPVAPPDDGVNMLADTKYEATERYTVGASLYEESDWSIPDDFKKGYLAGANPLWQGDTAPYGHLMAQEDEIGGHRIRLEVARREGQISALTLEGLPLGASEAGSRPTREWVPGLQAAMAGEHTEVEALYRPAQSEADLGASCPLQRWMFYSGGYTLFSPPIPSATRARHLFHRVNGARLAHPTMARAVRGEFLGQYRSANGFCACPVVPDIDQPQCRIPAGADSSRLCSLAQTVRALKGSDPHFASHAFVPLDHARAVRRCGMQLDWPSVDGTLRDGSAHEGDWSRASSPTHKLCHLLDRFVPFRYRYQMSERATLRRTTAGTTITEGVCQTARVVTLERGRIPAHARCLRTTPLTPDSPAAMRFTCNQSMPADFMLHRRVRLTRLETLERRGRRRQRCSQCSPPPAFKTAGGNPMPSESSFGRLYRPSVEKALAQDLREALGAACVANESGWRPGEFMRNYLFAPERLCRTTATPRAPLLVPQPAPDAALWNDGKPWVYCPTTSALRTGEGCKGTMTRREWVERKTELCPQMVRSFSRGESGTEDPLARTPFCNLDSSTDLVCKAVAEARLLVTQANCIARGDSDCMPSPYVYHPASYEPSNNAWVHDSVEAFYLKINGSACPSATRVHTAGDGLTQFARKYQLACPANALTLLEKLLVVVRVVITDVALLLSSALGLVMRLLALLITANTDQIKNSALDEWAYIRTKGGNMLQTVSDLLIDAMLNSGRLGAGIMAFLDSACEKINSFLSWFMHVWCKYVQQYMIQVMAALRKLVGIIGAGFEMLQDFMDEIFNGVLPATFVAKYAVNGFQAAMEARYSQPTSHSDDKGRARNHVPTAANARPISRIARGRNALVNVGKYAAGILSSPVGKMTGVLALASVALDIYSTVKEEAQARVLAEMMPENFSLFGYADVVNKFDDLESFLLEDATCYRYRQFELRNMTMVMFPCLSLKLSRYNATDEGTTAIDATQCWADATPSLGQNSLFACTASSTCCDTPACASRRVCGACEAPALELTNAYGCDSALRKCRCGTPKQAFDRCSANLQCDAGAQCELVSSLSGLRYGTLPCRLCPSDSLVVCLLSGGTMPGGCACMLERVVQLDTCSDASGMETSVDSTRLCGYLPGQTAASRTDWRFDMENLMLVPCAAVERGVCSTVYNMVGNARSSSRAGTTTVRMVVAVSLRGGARRRLLQEENREPETHADGFALRLSPEQLDAVLLAPGWDQAAAPCGVLAKAYQTKTTQLGVLGQVELERCGFWREVGRRTLAAHGLANTSDLFLLSGEDFLREVFMRPGGLLLLRPGVLLTALLYHPWMQAPRAIGVEIANRLEHLRWIRGIDFDVHEALFEGPVPPPRRERPRPRFNSSKSLVNASKGRRERPRPRFNSSKSLVNASKGRRKLLSVIDSAAAVAQFSGQVIVAARPGELPAVPVRVAGAWSTASFVWPPVYDYSGKTCPLALAALDIGRQAVRVNALYFKNFHHPPRPIDRSLRGNLPSLSLDGLPAPTGEALANATRSWASWVFHKGMDLAGIRAGDLVAWFTRPDRRWTLPWILETATRCDLAAVVTCSRHDKDLIMSTVVFLLLYLALRAVAGALGLGALATLFLLSYPGFILWYAFGTPPSCFPMVPTCLLSDVIATLGMLVPERLEFPEDLRCGNASEPLCLRSCEALNFTGWADPLAFAVCDTDPGTCRFLLERLPAESGMGVLDAVAWTPVREAVARFERVVSAPGREGLAGHRLCTWVSFVTATPALAALGGGVVLASAACMAALDLVPSTVAFVGQLYVFYTAGG